MYMYTFIYISHIQTKYVHLFVRTSTHLMFSLHSTDSDVIFVGFPCPLL